jgi:hypothetical protein
MRILPTAPAPRYAPFPSYAEQLAALEARRMAADAVFVRGMLRLREPGPDKV